MSKKYLVRYAGVMMPTGRFFQVQGVNFTFTQNSLTADVYDEVLAQTALDPNTDKFIGRVNKVYAELIDKWSCEPYISVDVAKEILVDERNNAILREMRKDSEGKIEALVVEMGEKQRAKRREIAELAGKKRKELEREVANQRGELSKDEHFIFTTEQLIKKSPNMPETEIFIKKQAINEAKERLNAQTSKYSRLNASIDVKVAEVEGKGDSEVNAIGDEFNSKINEIKAKADKAIGDKVAFLVERRAKEIALIDSIINLTADVDTEDDKLEAMTVADLKTLAVELGIDIKATKKSEIIAEILGSGKYTGV